MGGGRPRYMVRVFLRNEETFDIPLECKDGFTPYDFVIRFMIHWMWRPSEILNVDVFQDNIYVESYEPVNGWYKKLK